MQPRVLQSFLRSGVVLLLLSWAVPAWAHAVLQSSSPESGAQVAAGHAALVLRFNSRIDRSRSQLVLVRPDHSQTTLTIKAGDDQPERLAADADLAPGAYTVRWQVLAIDGHITRGTFNFTVQGH